MADVERFPKFRLLRFDPARAAEGRSAAQVEVTDADGSKTAVWLSMADLSYNVKQFGPKVGLLEAREAYRRGVAIDRLNTAEGGGDE